MMEVDSGIRHSSKMLAVIFLLFSTAGALGQDTVAENTTTNSTGVHFHMFPEFGYLTVYVMNVQNATEALSMLRNKCQLNETADFNQAKHASSRLAECFLSLINETTLVNLHSHSVVENVVHTLCNLQPEIVECGNNFLESITPCLDEVELESKQVMQNMSKHLVDVLCSESILPNISQAFSDVGCLHENSAAFEKCLSSFSMLETPADNKIVRILPDLTGSEEKCSDLKNKTSCFQEALLQCPDSILGGVIQKILDSFLVEICSKFNNPQTENNF